MINKRITLKILIIMMLIILIGKKSYCAEDNTVTKMEIVSSGSDWTNTTISESYMECEALNSTSSTLGTAALEAHLTTDFDWSIMAIFKSSQYGNINNNSSIKGVSTNTHTTTLLYNSTEKTGHFEKLYDSNGNLKKYIRKIDPLTGEEYNSEGKKTGRIAISFLSPENGGTLGWGGDLAAIYKNTSAPVGITHNLFGRHIGYGSCDGSAQRLYTFRPVIWN